MARHVNSTFGGVSVLDVDPNALTRTRWLDNAAGDTALVADLMTGANSPPTTLDHSGGGAGCPLGIPTAAQIMQSGDYRIQGDGDTSDVDACSLWAIVDYHPAGEGGITLRVDLGGYEPGPEPLRFEVRSTAWAVIDNVILTQVSGLGGTVWQARAQGLTGGTPYVYRLLCDDISTHVGGGFTIRSATLGQFRQASGPLLRATPSDVGDSSDLAKQTVSSAVVIDVQDLDAAEVTTEALAISGYHTTQIAQTQNALTEMLTGAPAGTNATRTLAPSATQGAYYDHSRLGSEFSSMPLIAHLPLGAWSLGAAPEDGGTGEDGVGGWLLCKNCPGWAIAANAAYRALFDWTGWMPRHAANKLRILVLAYSADGTINGATVPGVQARSYDDANTLLDTATNATWTQMGSSKWFVCQVSALDHYPEESNRILIDVRCTAASKTDGTSLRIAGISIGLVA